MARVVYSRRMMQGHLDHVGQTVLVPAGQTWIVRDIDVVNGEPGSTGDSISFLGAGVTFWFAQYTVAGQLYFAWRGRQVLTDVDELQTVAFGTSNWDYLISGYQLTPP